MTKITEMSLHLVLLLFCLSLGGCKTNGEQRRERDLRQINQLTEDLISGAQALQKLETIQAEDLGKMRLIASEEDTRQVAKASIKLETRYAVRIRETLKKLKRYQWEDVRNTLIQSHPDHVEAAPQIASREAAIRYADRSRLGMKVRAEDIIQDFQAASYPAQ